MTKSWEEILIDEMEAAEDEVHSKQEESFMDSLSQLQSSLYHIKTRIEDWLPKYQKLLDSMASMGQSKGPIDELRQLHSDLSYEFSQMAIESQKLRNLKPCTPAQQKVLKNVVIATYQFFNFNMDLFRTAC